MIIYNSYNNAQNFEYKTNDTLNKRFNRKCVVKRIGAKNKLSLKNSNYLKYLGLKLIKQ